jgi:predicted Zn-dependent protease
VDKNIDPFPFDRVQAILQKMPVIELTRQKYKFAIADKESPNAFVSPKDKLLILHQGLLDTMDDKELTMVIFHENAHVKFNHVGKNMTASYVTTTVFQIANIFLPGVGYANLIVNPIVTATYSREQELEADKDSVDMGDRMMNIPPEVYISALNKLKQYAIQKNLGDKDITGLFDSHPNLEYRIERIREEAIKLSGAAMDKDKEQDKIATYSSVIESNPQDAETYYNRGSIYLQLLGADNYRKALNDYQKAARLGHKKAQDYLKSKGIEW